MATKQEFDAYIESLKKGELFGGLVQQTRQDPSKFRTLVSHIDQEPGPSIHPNTPDRLILERGAELSSAFERQGLKAFVKNPKEFIDEASTTYGEKLAENYLAFSPIEGVHNVVPLHKRYATLSAQIHLAHSDSKEKERALSGLRKTLIENSIHKIKESFGDDEENGALAQNMIDIYLTYAPGAVLIESTKEVGKIQKEIETAYLPDKESRKAYAIDTLKASAKEDPENTGRALYHVLRQEH